MAGTATISTIKHDVTGAATTFRDGSGNEIGQLTKSWLSYNGSTPVVNGSFNISSATRTATGKNTINFTNAFADTKFCPAHGRTPTTLLASNPWAHVLDFTTFATTSVAVETGFCTSGAASFTDFPGIFISVTR